VLAQKVLAQKVLAQKVLAQKVLAQKVLAQKGSRCQIGCQTPAPAHRLDGRIAQLSCAG